MVISMFDLSHFNHIEEHVYVLNREDDRGNTSSCMAITGGFSDAVLEAYAGKIDCLISMPVSLVSVNGSTSVAEQSTHMNVEKAVVLQQFYERKSILLKPGSFCVEFLPEENGDNYRYLYKIKEMAHKAGLEYYCKVPWQKQGFVANTGRKSKDTEDICFFTKGKARALRPDAKKDKQYAASREIVEFKEFIPGSTTVHASEMGGLGISYETNVAPVNVNIRLSVAKEDADKAKLALEEAWDNAVIYSCEDSPLDKDNGGTYSYEELYDMPVQEYMLKLLENSEIPFVDLSPGPENIFDSTTQVIVNPVNLIGPMGAGLAKEFKERYPDLEPLYKFACKNRATSENKFINPSGETGRLLLREQDGIYEGDIYITRPAPTDKEPKPPVVLCFPTKRDWRDPSDLALIEAGLKTFVQNYKDFHIKSITFPKLGCGLGGLNWEKEVKPLMQKYLGSLPDLDVRICGDTLKVDQKDHFMSGAHGMLPISFSIEPPHKSEKIHQAEKPIDLLMQILEYVTLPGETALDQFAGSGVLGEAALRTGRNSILIEKDVETFQKITERLQVLGTLEAVTPAAQTVISIGADAIVAQDAFNRTGDRDIIYNFVETHTMPDPAVFFQGEHDLRKGATPEQQEAISKAYEAFEDIDLRSHDLDLTQGAPEPSEDRKSNPEAEHQPKVLECSSRGDRRFSALFAMVKIASKEQSIEEWYQNAKRTADGKRAGKGKPFDHIIDPFTGDKLPAGEASNLYKGLWITYLTNHPDLVEYAKGFDEFHDMFRGKNTVNCQADVVAAFVRDSESFIRETKSSAWYQNMALKLKAPKKSLSEQVAAAEAKKETQMNAQQLRFDRADNTRSSNIAEGR